MQHYIVIDLEKAHVKAHFRRDPKTGKLIFIKDYDSKIHGKADAEFNKGQQVEVDNPRSKFHGKTMTVRHYSDKYDVVRLDIPGKSHTADFEPHMLKPVSASTSTTPAAPTTATAAPPMTLDDAKTALGLAGMSYSSAEMIHERKRVESMTAAQLEARIPKIKTDQKLYNFMRALRQYGIPDKHDVAKKIEGILIDRAKAKKATTPAASVTPAAPATPKTTFDPGDRVRIDNPRSKHHGKEGVVSSFSDKYNVVRMKLDDGTYTDASPKAVVNLAGNPKPAAQAKKAAARPQPQKQPEAEPPKPAEKPKVASDFPHDKVAAWKYSTIEQRSLAKTTGMVPLDKAAADYMKKNLDRIMKQNQSRSSYGRRGYVGGRWYGVKTRSGYTVPQWANQTLNSSYKRLSPMKELLRNIPTDWTGDNDKIKQSPIGVMFYGEAEWEKNGYDYNKDIKPNLDPIVAGLKEAGDAAYRHKGFDVVNVIMHCAYSRLANKNDMTTMAKRMQDHVKLDTPLADVLAHYKQADPSTKFDSNETLNLMHAMCGPDFTKSSDQATFGDFLKGYEKFVSGYKFLNSSTVGKKTYDTDAYIKYLTRHSKIARQAWDALDRNYSSPSYKIQGLFNYSSSYHGDDHLKMTQYILSDGAKPNPKKYWSAHYEIFHGNVSSKVSDGIVDGLDGKIQANEILRNQFGANVVGQEGSSTISKNWNREFKARIFPEGLMKDQGPRAIGVRVARMSGSIDSIVDGLSKRYWKEIERQKKLKAKGVKPDDKADEGVPPPDNLGCTFSSVDDKTAEFVRKKIEKAWDKGGVHGGFYFKIHGIYRIGGMDHYKKFKKIEDDRDNIMFGYHSTNFALASSIVKSNYRPSSGGMLGPGLYVTDVSSKSAQYLLGNCNVTRNPGTRGVFLVNKISLGKVHDYSKGATNDKKHEVKSKADADSIYAPKGKFVPGYSTDVKNDEHVVLDSNAAIPMYWVDLELTDRFGNTKRP